MIMRAGKVSLSPSGLSVLPKAGNLWCGLQLLSTGRISFTLQKASTQLLKPFG